MPEQTGSHVYDLRTCTHCWHVQDQYSFFQSFSIFSDSSSFFQLLSLASASIVSVFYVLDTRVEVKYNWSSTQILQVLVIKYKYKYNYFAFSPIKYSSTSSTDTPSTSTSTSTSVNIGWLIYTGNTRAVIPGKYRSVQ